MENEDFSSDSSDEDYVPTECVGVSEEEDSGDEEDFVPDDTTAADSSTFIRKKTKILKKTTHKKKDGIIPRKRKGGIQLEGEPDPTETEAVPISTTQPVEASCDSDVERDREAKQTEAEKKKRADSLWSDFLSDVGSTRPKASPATNSPASTKSPDETAKPSQLSSTAGTLVTAATVKPNRISVVKEYNFAGETVQIVKEVAADSKEAKEELDKRLGTTTSANPGVEPPSSSTGMKRPGVGGGLGSVLGKINKKPKISVLDKSKVDWDGFKQQEGIGDELKIHNRGKEGYLERQAFLQRTDLRQYEIERSLRLGSSTK